MKNKYILYGIIFLILISVIVVDLGELNMREWRSDNLRYNYEYDVQINGLSGRESTGTTIVMIPIPATKDGEFVTTPSQKEPSFAKQLVQEYILHTPQSHRRGPYFKNTTEALDNKSIRGNWITFIAETEDGYMLGFKTNESILEDISFRKLVVVDYVDIFDPISKNSPLLYPTSNISKISMTPYGDQSVYSSNPSYESYVYLSDNIEKGTTHFRIGLTAKNDVTEWPFEYRGHYDNSIEITTNDTGKISVRAVLTQHMLKSGPLVKLPDFEEPPEDFNPPEGWQPPELEIED